MSLRAAARIRLLRSLLCSSSRPIFNALKTYNALKSTCQVSQPVDITCRPGSTISGDARPPIRPLSRGMRVALRHALIMLRLLIGLLVCGTACGPSGTDHGNGGGAGDGGSQACTPGTTYCAGHAGPPGVWRCNAD